MNKSVVLVVFCILFNTCYFTNNVSVNRLDALHEAGHAIAAHYVGFTVTEISLELQGDTLGHVNYLTDTTDLNYLYKELFTISAGYLIESIDTSKNINFEIYGDDAIKFITISNQLEIQYNTDTIRQFLILNKTTADNLASRLLIKKVMNRNDIAEFFKDNKLK